MKVKTVSKNIGISPIKAKVVADVVRGMNAEKASATLQYVNKGASIHVKKAIDAAIADAKHNFNLSSDNLIIGEIKVDKGPQAKLNTKRGFTLGKGGYAMFNRKYAHITVVLEEKDDMPKVEGKKKSVKAVKSEKLTENKAEALDTETESKKEVKSTKKVEKKNKTNSVKTVKNKEGK